MSRPLVVALTLFTSAGCLGYRSSGDARAPQQQPAGAPGVAGHAPPPPAPTGASAPTTAPTNPAAAMIGSAWTLFGMLTQGMPAPAPQQPAPQQPAPQQPAPQQPGVALPQLPWPFPFPLPVMTGAPPTPSAPGPAPGPTSGDAPAEWVRLEDEVLALTNQRRAQGATCGAQAYPPAPPLSAEPRLRQAARGHAADMGARGYFDHKSPEGRTPVDRAKAAGFQSSFVGENIAAGYGTAGAVVAGWIKSPGHCANIMDPRYTLLGVGYSANAKSSMGDYWVQNFGK